MLKVSVLLVFVVPLTACSAIPALAPVAVRATDAAYAPFLPNPGLTPGDTLAVTPNDFCRPGYSSKIRDVPESVKNEVYQKYAITAHKPGEYEVDHLISLELGGSNSVKNLWPEPYQGQWNAHVKDRLEDSLHSLVCAGKVDYQTAQHEISTDWVAAYKKYIGPNP